MVFTGSESDVRNSIRGPRRTDAALTTAYRRLSLSRSRPSRCPLRALCTSSTSARLNTSPYPYATDPDREPPRTVLGVSLPSSSLFFRLMSSSARRRSADSRLCRSVLGFESIPVVILAGVDTGGTHSLRARDRACSGREPREKNDVLVLVSAEYDGWPFRFAS